MRRPLTRRGDLSPPGRGKERLSALIAICEAADLGATAVSIKLHHGAIRGELHLSPLGRGRREAAGEGATGNGDGIGEDKNREPRSERNFVCIRERVRGAESVTWTASSAELVIGLAEGETRGGLFVMTSR
jgi:hypothetical protein